MTMLAGPALGRVRAARRPWRIAQYMAYPAGYRIQATSSRRAFIARIPIYIGSCDWSALRLMMHGWYLGSNLGNSYTITKAALEYSGAYKAITFGGADGLTVADGATEVMSDLITPAPLYAGNVLRHSVPYTRLEGYIDSPTGYFAGGVYAAFGGAVGYVYDPGTTTPLSSAYGTGSINTTGLTVFGTAEIPIPVMVVGIPAGAEAAVPVMYGDSIGYNLGGVIYYGAGANSGGWFWRSLRTAGKGVYNSGLYAGLNCGVSGATQGMIKSYANMLALSKYCNLAVEEGGINGLASASVSIADTQEIWASLRSHGISSDRLIRTKITPRTTSPGNSWADAAGQTYATYHGVGGNADAFNAFVDTALADGDIAAIMPMDSIRDPGDSRKWISNGTALYATPDGLHPSAVSHDLLVGEYAPIWQGVATAHGLWNG